MPEIDISERIVDAGEDDSGKYVEVRLDDFDDFGTLGRDLELLDFSGSLFGQLSSGMTLEQEIDPSAQSTVRIYRDNVTNPEAFDPLYESAYQRQHPTEEGLGDAPPATPLAGEPAEVYSGETEPGAGEGAYQPRDAADETGDAEEGLEDVLGIPINKLPENLPEEYRIILTDACPSPGKVKLYCTGESPDSPIEVKYESEDSKKTASGILAKPTELFIKTLYDTEIRKRLFALSKSNPANSGYKTTRRILDPAAVKADVQERNEPIQELRDKPIQECSDICQAIDLADCIIQAHEQARANLDAPISADEVAPIAQLTGGELYTAEEYVKKHTIESRKKQELLAHLDEPYSKKIGIQWKRHVNDARREQIITAVSMDDWALAEKGIKFLVEQLGNEQFAGRYRRWKYSDLVSWLEKTRTNVETLKEEYSDSFSISENLTGQIKEDLKHLRLISFHANTIQDAKAVFVLNYIDNSEPSMTIQRPLLYTALEKVVGGAAEEAETILEPYHTDLMGVRIVQKLKEALTANVMSDTAQQILSQAMVTDTRSETSRQIEQGQTDAITPMEEIRPPEGTPSELPPPMDEFRPPEDEEEQVDDSGVFGEIPIIPDLEGYLTEDTDETDTEAPPMDDLEEHEIDEEEEERQRAEGGVE